MFLWINIFLVVIIYIVKHVYSYWERKGFPSLKSQIPLGCLGPVIRQTQSMGELMRDVHLANKEPYLGLYFFFRPSLMVSDPALVKRILITDFDHFHDRGVHYDEENDPVAANLFAMPGQKWKDLRAKLSPTFTSGKLKNMFQPVVEKTHLLKEHLNQIAESGDDVRLKTMLIRLNLSITASVFFGFELNAFEDPDHEFNKMGDLFFDTTKLRNKFVMFAFQSFPSLLKWFKIPTLSPVVSKYVMNLVNSVMEARKADPTLVRKDFIQTVMELMEDAGENEKLKLTVEKCAAQAFLFYTAGYETSAATTSFCMYELSKDRVWMERARAEVDAMMKKRNGKLEYDDLVEMKVLDMCIKEAMRKYPAVPILNRECTVEYKIPGTDTVIPKGTSIVLPIYGLHLDPNHFPDPERFDPSRFEKENADLPYYPLGGGPRFCVGARLGFMMIRMALCTLLHNFDFQAIDEKLELLPGNILLADKNSIHMKISKRTVENKDQ